MKKDFRYNAYPFLSEKSYLCDYEILTDGLSSEIGFAISFVKNQNIKDDLTTICKIVLTLNPLARHQKVEMIDRELKLLNKLYEKYNIDFDSFYLPIGSTEATSISKLRTTPKNIIRLLHRNNGNPKLIDAFNLLCNLFHLIYLNLQKERIEFKSEVYK